MRTYVGIDPGLSGAVAVIYADTSIALFDAPDEYNPADMTDILSNIKINCQGNLFVMIERAQAMTKINRHGKPAIQGVVSMFNYGVGFGMWLGVLAALGISYGKVQSQSWMKEIFAGRERPKEKKLRKAMSRQIALELYPTADIRLSKHHGRAEALLIAEYARRLHA